jgi:Ni/Co efflux regulator RcnB
MHPMAADVPMGTHFHMVQRQAAQAWFEEPEHRGFVPPGLAKKGGMPPGQARAWQRGQPLPAGVVWYVLPRSLELVLGPPPAGHRYVRVATDILLIAIGTGLVVDAMEDLAR